MQKGRIYDPIPLKKPSITPIKKHHRDNGLHKKAMEIITKLS